MDTDTSDHREFCQRAYAYIKVALPTDTPADLVVSDDDMPVSTDLENGLLVFYLVDTGDEFRYVQQRHLTRARMSAQQLHEIALANLAAFAHEELTVYEQPGYYAAIMGGNFEASLILIDSLWEETLSGLVPGDYVVAIPARDILAFSGLGDPRGIQQLKGVIERLPTDADHQLTRTLYRRKDGRWEPLAA